MKTAIVIPYNTAEEMTLECLSALERTTEQSDTYCIVVNGYVDEPNPITHGFIDKLVTVKNESYCKTINAGFKEIPLDCDRIFFMGNDSFPKSDDWLLELERIREKYNTVVLSPDYTIGGKTRAICYNEDITFHSMIPSIHFYMKIEHFEKVGFMDERFIGACYYSDDDYCRRVTEMYGEERIARCNHLIFEHRCSVEGKALNMTRGMQANYAIYQEKWK